MEYNPRVPDKSITRKSTEEDFQTMVRGRRVAIVGPAPSICGLGLGKDIDSCDIVIRTNRAVPIPPAMWKDFGSKTDILYSCLWGACGNYQNSELLCKNGVKLICSGTPHENAISGYKGTIPLKRVALGVFYPLSSFINGKLPHTGTMAIAEVANSKATEIFVVGMTFYQTGNIYVKYYGGGAQWEGHNQRMEFLWFRRLALQDKRIRMDPVLSKIITNIAAPSLGIPRILWHNLVPPIDRLRSRK